MRSRCRVIIVAIAAVMLVGCAPQAFDEARWNASPAFEHPAAMAGDIVERGLVSGMTFDQVRGSLGEWDASGIPLMTLIEGETPKPPESASVGYQLKGGGMLTIEFTDGVVSSAKVEGT